MQNKYCTLKNSKLIWKIEKVDNDKAHLAMNNKKMITDLDNITILENYLPEGDCKVSITTSNDNVSSEIMLRHLTKPDAMEKLDKFIDNAITSGLARVKIIHGKSGGVIRKATHEYLDKHPYISSYNFGDYHEGGFGVTIAYIKRYN